MHDCLRQLEQRRERRALGAQLQQFAGELEQQRGRARGLGITLNEIYVTHIIDTGAKGGAFLL